MKRIVLIILMIGLVPACSKVVVQRMTDGNDYGKEGIRFYRPYPYLKVTQGVDKDTQKEVFSYEIVWLPDLSQEYVMKVEPGLGKVDFKPNLQDGWMLTGMDLNLDPQTKEIIEAVAGIAKDIPKRAVVVPEIRHKPGIYRFVYDMEREKDGEPNPNYGKITGIEPVVVFIPE